MNIESIQFGILSADEIRNMSVGEIDSITKKIGAHRSVYDLRMGPDIPTKTACLSCGLSLKKCPGHFGHIELPIPVPHPLCLRSIVFFLRCFCKHCGKLLVSPATIHENQTPTEVQNSCAKIETCIHCEMKNGPIQLCTDPLAFRMHTSRNKNEADVVLSPQNIFQMFDRIADDDIRLFRYIPKQCHPRNLILTALPVLPPCSRPYVISDGNICDDDLTCQYVEIIKNVNTIKQLQQEVDKLPKDHTSLIELGDKIDKAYNSVYFRIDTLFNNSAGKAKHPSNARPTKGFKERLTGKSGLVRNNILGKRVEQSARTVIGADPYLRTCELGVPKEFAEKLSYPEVVTDLNKDKLLEMMLDGRAKSYIPKGSEQGCQKSSYYSLWKPGTILFHNDIVLRDGKEMKDVKELKEGDMVIRNGEMIEVELPQRKNFQLNVGDKVVRQLVDGDVVLLNRQPTLHSGSMIAQRIRVLEGKTLRFNLAICSLLNSDFDGDESNIHIPGSAVTQAELLECSSIENHLVSLQSGKMGIKIVQDTMLGLYLLSRDNKPIAKGRFHDILCRAVDGEGKAIPIHALTAHLKYLTEEMGDPYCGHGLLSMMMPLDLTWKSGKVVIDKGVFREGIFTKSIIHKLLLHIAHYYSKERVMMMTDAFQFFTNQWMMQHGFSIGLGDCMPTRDLNTHELMMKYFMEADHIAENTLHPGIREMRINGSLSKARDIGMKIAKDSLSAENNFISTVESGSKGDYFNIAQITGLLGQQNLRGQRFHKVMNHGRRTLPHYPFKCESSSQEYESRGFISNSFIEGLNPREFFLHSQSGREGITNKVVFVTGGCYHSCRFTMIGKQCKIYCSFEQYNRLVNLARLLIMSGNSLELQLLSQHGNMLVATLIASGMCKAPALPIVRTLKIGQSAVPLLSPLWQGYGVSSETYLV